MAQTYLQNSFNAGELSPRLKGRSDLDKYKSGLFTCLNTIPLPHGGITRRPGLQYINEVKDSTVAVELIPFEFSETQAYVLEFGDNYMRVYKEGGLVLTPDSYTVLLLHCDGLDGDYTFADDGYTGHTITANNDVVVDAGITGQYYFGTGSATFDGADDYLSISDHADWNFGASEFTIDLWVRFYSITGIHTLWYQSDATTGDMIWLYVDHERGQNLGGGSLNLRVVDGGVLLTHIVRDWSPSADTWYHVACVRGWASTTNNFALVVNGTILGAADVDAITMPDHDGEIDIGLGPSAIIDISNSAHVMTKHADADISTDAAKWGDASIIFDGTGDYVTSPTSSDWDVFNQTNVTVSFWVKHTTHATTQKYIGQFFDATHKWYLEHIHGSGLRAYMNDGGTSAVTDTGGEITDNNWHHVAFIRVGSGLGMYLDGVQKTWGNSANTATFVASLELGAENGGTDSPYDGYMDDVIICHENMYGASPNASKSDSFTVPTYPALYDASIKLHLRVDLTGFDGWLDEYRVSKGVARWTANFTVNTLPYPAAGGGTTYELATPYDAAFDVSLLRTVQATDTMYIAHPHYNVYYLTRTDDDSWTITEMDWDQPPWNEVNTTAITLDPSDVTGTVTVTASGSFFTPSHVGAYFWQANGFYRVTVYTNPTTVTAVVKSDLDDHVATATWKQGTWDDTQGYPSFLTFHEDRLVAVGDAYHPLRVFLSETGNYINMGLQTDPIASDDPLNQDIWSQQLNVSKWAISGKRLFIGTVGSEFWMTGSTIDTPITASSILVRRESTIGSATPAPIAIGSSIMFAQKESRKLIDWHYNTDEDGYVGDEISILSEHLLRNTKITKMQYAQNPNSIVWIILDDGTLLGMTYLREHKVVGWSRHSTSDDTADGTFESIAVIPGNPVEDFAGDEVWVSVKRKINGSDVRYIERMRPVFFGGTLSEDAVYLDSSLSSLNGAASTTFAGLDHLEAEEVAVFADGAYRGDFTVSSGSITITGAAATDVHAGKLYNSDMEFLVPRDRGIDKRGVDYNRIYRVGLMLYEGGYGAEVGYDSSHLLDVLQLTDGSVNTGEYRQSFNGPYSLFPTVYIRQGTPAPFTLLAALVEIDEGEDAQ